MGSVPAGTHVPQAAPALSPLGKEWLDDQSTFSHPEEPHQFGELTQLAHRELDLGLKYDHDFDLECPIRTSLDRFVRPFPRVRRSSAPQVFSLSLTQGTPCRGVGSHNVHPNLRPSPGFMPPTREQLPPPGSQAF